MSDAEDLAGEQYRAYTPDLEVAGTGDGRTIRGIAVPYNQVQVINRNLTEEFLPGAFDHQMNALHRVKFMWGHRNQGGVQIGHMTAARNDAAGLYGEWHVSKTTAGNDALELAKDGALDQMSVGFRTVQSGSHRTPQGVIQRAKAHLFEVALVPEGAYGDGATVTGIRSADGGACPLCGHVDVVERSAEPASRERFEAAQRRLAGLKPLPTLGS